MLVWAKENDDIKRIRINPVIVINKNECFFIIYPLWIVLRFLYISNKNNEYLKVLIK
jgi:hypothetical protein